MTSLIVKMKLAVLARKMVSFIPIFRSIPRANEHLSLHRTIVLSVSIQYLTRRYSVSTQNCESSKRQFQLDIVFVSTLLAPSFDLQLTSL